jgi:hypothetical protein
MRLHAIQAFISYFHAARVLGYSVAAVVEGLLWV